MFLVEALEEFVEIGVLSAVFVQGKRITYVDKVVSQFLDGHVLHRLLGYLLPLMKRSTNCIAFTLTPRAAMFAQLVSVFVDSAQRSFVMIGLLSFDFSSFKRGMAYHQALSARPLPAACRYFERILGI